ncbi:hypothetical protein HU200_023539 [Digitaria exilis]|uniref:Uncharacterized protein n=1 Tax=Digitaria exilis TaxID=1010633 RepID=A0A835C943_9POAL|nr:hypothetical protein HU200_023539 [Digitaria exilis]CAB3496033.1 unnamed protein product [Digitaria exilis]
MQPVSRLALAPPRVGAPCQQAPRATTTTPRRGRASPFWRVAPSPRRRLRARASCGGGGATEPVEAAREGVVPAVDQDQDREEEEEGGLAAEELEVLEEAAIAGVDEGRRPTDYDRRAHIFEESSRVFRDLKHQRDGDAGVAAATAAETATREQQH